MRAPLPRRDVTQSGRVQQGDVSLPLSLSRGAHLRLRLEALDVLAPAILSDLQGMQGNILVKLLFTCVA